MRLKEAPNIGDRLCTTIYVFIHNELYIGCDYVQDTYQHCNLSLVRSSITATPCLLRNDLYTTGPRKWHYQVILLRSIELVIINYSIYLPQQVKIIKMIYSILFTQENRLLLSPQIIMEESVLLLLCSQIYLLDSRKKGTNVMSVMVIAMPNFVQALISRLYIYLGTYHIIQNRIKQGFFIH